MATKNVFTKILKAGAVLTKAAKKWLAAFDKRTGLMWQKDDVRVSSWNECANVIKKLNAEKFAGYSDWRLPTVEELFCLVDRTRSNPSIDTAYFPDCKSDWYWTSTPDAESPSDCVWVVYFYSGGSYRGYRNHGGFVRAVRGGQ